MAAPDRFAPKSDDFAAQAVLTSRAGGTAGVHLLPLSSPNSLLRSCICPGNRIARKSARFKTEGCPGTLLAKLSVVQDGRQADIRPVAWDIVWGFILLDFGCKKNIFYIEIIGFMVY